MPELRFDSFGQLRRAHRTPEGYLLAEVAAMRTGVLEYYKDGTLRRELVPPEELEKALPSLARVPTTLKHPEPEGRVDSSNTKELATGLTDWDVRLSRDGWARTAVQVIRQDAVEAAERKPYVSVGKYCRTEPTPGFWNPETQEYRLGDISPGAGWQHFDSIQRDIGVNHLALSVDIPRAGSGAALHLDGTSVPVCDLRTDEIVPRNGEFCVVSKDGKHEFGCFPNEQQAQERLAEVEMFKHMKKDAAPMPKIKLDGIEYECPEPLAGPVQALVQKADAAKTLEQERNELREKVTRQTAELEGLKGKLAAYEAAAAAEPKADALDQENARLEARLDALSAGAAVGLTDLRKKPTAQIVREVVGNRRPTVSLEGKSDEFVGGLFEAIKPELKTPSFDAIRAAMLEADGKTPKTDAQDIKALRADGIKRLAAGGGK